MLAVVFPGVGTEPAVVPPERERAQVWTREDAVRELVRGRLEAVGPTTAAALAAALGLAAGDVDVGLPAPEREGVLPPGPFTPGPAEPEWCGARLPAGIHPHTSRRLAQGV